MYYPGILAWRHDTGGQINNLAQLNETSHLYLKYLSSLLQKLFAKDLGFLEVTLEAMIVLKGYLNTILFTENAF